MTPSPARVDVLVADDNADAADSLAELIRMLGYSVQAVYDGRAAVDACAVVRPQVVILDVQMPVLNGCEAAKVIHAHACAPRLLASLTCLNPTEEPMKSGGCHFDLHLDKPIRFEQLESLLAGVLGTRG